MALLPLSLFLAALLAHSPLLLADDDGSSKITMVGAVYCDTCFNNVFSKHSYFMPGADVHIQCRFKAISPRTSELISFSVNRTTDKFGVYRLEVPSVDGVDCIDGPAIQTSCQASLISSSSSACNAPASRATTNEIQVKSKQSNLCIYSFTPLSFRPIQRNYTLCGKQTEQFPTLNVSNFFLPYGLSWPSPSQLPPLPRLPFPFRFPFQFYPPPNPSTPSLPFLQPPPPPSFNLRDPRTWIPNFPSFSPPTPPQPTFNPWDPDTWNPNSPPSSSPAPLNQHP